MTAGTRIEPNPNGAGGPEPCSLRLFVAGNEPNSALARASLQKVCELCPPGSCTVEVIDVLEDFQPALAENILVTPALVIHRAGARAVIFGNLTDTDKVLAALQAGGEKKS